jgi:hypothetical protein
MQDSAMQTEAGASQTALPTELALRILRRRTEPLGVIDVQQPQQHYARTAGWVAQRFALLDHWKTRYGSDEDTASANAGFVFAMPGQPMAEPSRVYASPTQLARAANPAVESQPSPAAAMPAPPEQFRVRRRGTSPAGGDTVTINRADDSAVTSRLQAARGELRVAEIPAITHQAAPTSPTLILPKRLAGNIEAEETAADATHNVERSSQRELASPPEAAATSWPTAGPSGTTGISHLGSERPAATAAVLTQTPVRLSHIEASSAALPLRLQRQPGEAAPEGAPARSAALPLRLQRQPGEAAPEGAPARSAALPLRLQRQPGEAAPEGVRVQELTAPVVSTPTTEMALAKPAAGLGHEPSALLGGERAVSDMTYVVAEQPGFAGIEPTPVQVASLVSLPLVQRQSVDSAPSAETAPDDALSQRAAVAAEIRPTSASTSQPAMVWRQSANGSAAGDAGSALPLGINSAPGGELLVARQTTATESPPSTNTESTALAAATPMPAAPPGNGIDIAHLAEQVSRLLARQLTVERERRGRRGWH